MSKDYLSELKYLGLISRIKRLCDGIIADGRKVYKHIDIGIEPNWFLVFRILKEQGESTISEISSILGFAHPSIIAIVKKMDAAGYLTIKTSTYDKRKQVIKLSQSAKVQMPEMEKVWDASEKAVRSMFPNDSFMDELKNLESAVADESFFDRVIDKLDNTGIKIEAFQAENAKRFAELNVEWLESLFSVEPIDKKVLYDPQKYIIEKDGFIFMTKYQGKVAGTFALLPSNKTDIELCRMAVDPIFRGNGLGNKMIEKAIHVAKDNGFRNIVLYSSLKLIPAIKLYKKYGFKFTEIEQTSKYLRADVKMILNLES